jgi:decaprenylphospho-beta-D-ribofuranose 2-oxidase
MSSESPPARPSGVAGGDDRLLSGWGRTSPTRATVRWPLTDEDVARVLAAPPRRGVVARGLGRSYGDAAQNAGGTVLDMTSRRGVLDADLEAGWVRAAAGTSLDDLMRWLLPRGWFVPVTPGTRMVTLGGAIAADIHGKNHHRDGSFGDHVRALRLRTGGGDELTCSPAEHPEVFWATVGGMGLTGVILDATVALLPVETAWMLVDAERAADLDDLMARMEARDDEYRYSVAWIDCLARGGSLGRGVITRGDHAPLEALDRPRRERPRHFDPSPVVTTPQVVPPGLVNRLSVRAFNELWFRKAPRRRHGHLESISYFFHPLDGVVGWNRLYGPRGFVQYQFVVPFGAEDALRDAVELMSGTGAASFLAVLKRFGHANPGPLSFPAPGWTLALDLPAGSVELAGLLDRMDEIVLAAGGRVYLAKDARVRPDHLRRMYPRLAEWADLRAKLDPAGTVTSDLARRLGL